MYRLVSDEEDEVGEWVLISGIKWRLWAGVEDGYLWCSVECEGGDKDNWHSKAKYWMRLRNPTTGRHEMKEDSALFDKALTSLGYRWLAAGVSALRA